MAYIPNLRQRPKAAKSFPYIDTLFDYGSFLRGAGEAIGRLPSHVAQEPLAVVGSGIGGLVAAKFLFVEQALGPVIRSGILPEIDAATLVWVSPILLAIGAGLAAVSAYVTLRLYVKV